MSEPVRSQDALHLPDVNTDGRDLRAAASGEFALRFPARWLEEHTVLPLEMDKDGMVVVAASSTVSTTISDALQRTLRAPVRFVTVPEGEVRAALLATDRGEIGGAGGDAIDGRADGLEGVDDLRALASREPVVQVVNAMFAEALQAKASDIHVESTPQGLRVRFRLDGVLRDAQMLGRPFQSAVLSRLKIVAGLDIAERRLPQDGRARVRVANREVDVRVSTLPALHGESMVLRLLDHGTTSRTLTTLGIADDIQARFSAMLTRSSGLLLVTGPTGSGKTTTLYAALAARSAPGIKVVTVEDPVEYRLEGITQLPVNTRAGFTFANALRAILRHDPDVILVGEMRDTETAEVAVQAALTGHLVLSTLHTTDAASAVTRLTEMGIAPYLVAATLQGVLAQRLVRTLCERCATWHDAGATERALMGENGASRIRHAVGCEACAGTGYQGRAAIAELLVLTDAFRANIIRGASLEQLRTSAREQDGRSLRDDGWRLVRAGTTTIDEVVRVVSEDESR
ncbi:MAG: type II/IV secretion system protein [Phycisphaerae bacterium]|nr:type II/IV secretion system protein [Gemmatimonadaceae bacterium]